MKHRRERIGVFVVGGLALFGIGMFLIGDRHQLFARHTEYYAEFVNLAGLANGAKVRVAGMDAGQVLAVSVPDSPSARFRVQWRIDAKLRGLVRTDSVVTIGTEGIVGGTYLSVRPGSAQAPQATPGAIIPSKEPSDLADLLAGGEGLLNVAHGTLDRISTTVANVNDVVVGLKEGRGTAGMFLRDEPLKNEIRQTVTATSSTVRDVAADLKAGRGVAGMLLRDAALEAQVRGAVDHAQQATANLSHATGQADNLVSELNSRQIPQKAGEAMDKVHEIIYEVAKPDNLGMSAGANIRESLTNANTATLNLADASEALKHNFFLRGFFQRRGYYNLTDISPEKYRNDRAFTNPANYRVWLSGSELFQNGVNGEEELSASGKEILKAAVTEYGSGIVESPIVIEGYWNGNPLDDQLRLSRGRALAVRGYLQAQFQIDTRNVGVVPMKNAPPSKTGRTTWDGTCLVVLRKA
jgi:phospholipid/cholesterol/gamma-HCH transport system substrate-binding protein